MTENFRNCCNFCHIIVISCNFDAILKFQFRSGKTAKLISLSIITLKKSATDFTRLQTWLPHRDSNSVKQNQNLVCYHYTMGQSSFSIKEIPFCGRKDSKLFLFHQIIFKKNINPSRRTLHFGCNHRQNRQDRCSVLRYLPKH